MTLDQALLYHSTGLEEAEEATTSQRGRLGIFFLVAVAATVSIIGLKRHRAHAFSDDRD